jgi:hypothetical protein
MVPTLTATQARAALDLAKIAERSGNPTLAVAAAQFLRAVRARELAKAEHPDVLEGQLALWVARPDGSFEGWRGRLKPTDPVRCDHFGCSALPIKTCLDRQGAKWPGGNRWGDGSVKAKKAGIHPYCSSGQCEQGKGYAEQVQVGWTARRFKFYRDDTPAQRLARKRFIRTRPDGEVPFIDSTIEKEPEE